MPDIDFTCPLCHKNLSVDEKGAGLVVDCPECQGKIRIPKNPDHLVSRPQHLSPLVIGLLVAVGVLALWALIASLLASSRGTAAARLRYELARVSQAVDDTTNAAWRVANAAILSASQASNEALKAAAEFSCALGSITQFAASRGIFITLNWTSNNHVHASNTFVLVRSTDETLEQPVSVTEPGKESDIHRSPGAVGIDIVSHHSSRTHHGTFFVSGIVKNNTDTERSFIGILIDFYDIKGNRCGGANTFIRHLKPGTATSFTVNQPFTTLTKGSAKVTDYRIVEITTVRLTIRETDVSG